MKINEVIRKVKGGYRLYSKDGKKNLGTYPTRAGAEKRERQVQYFKHRNEDAAGVGIITKQNTTKDVKPGDEYKNVKKLSLENFADKKVKGKSRPGRVKRAGASCKGSVSSLRAKAKKYGGERGKMYHWCANMKSGRKKSK